MLASEDPHAGSSAGRDPQEADLPCSQVSLPPAGTWLHLGSSGRAAAQPPAGPAGGGPSRARELSTAEAELRWQIPRTPPGGTCRAAGAGRPPRHLLSGHWAARSGPRPREVIETIPRLWPAGWRQAQGLCRISAWAATDPGAPQRPAETVHSPGPTAVPMPGGLLMTCGVSAGLGWDSQEPCCPPPPRPAGRALRAPELVASSCSSAPTAPPQAARPPRYSSQGEMLGGLAGRSPKDFKWRKGRAP